MIRTCAADMSVKGGAAQESVSLTTCHVLDRSPLDKPSTKPRPSKVNMCENLKIAPLEMNGGEMSD